MPAVKPGESRNDYVKRCVSYVVEHEGLTTTQAVGKCEGMYTEHAKKSLAKKLLVATKSLLTSQTMEVDPNELYIGTCEEMEHTDDWKTAMRIALDHLQEDGDYYKKLTQAGLLHYDVSAPHELTLDKGKAQKSVSEAVQLLDLTSYLGEVRKAKSDKWKNSDGTFKGGFKGCVAYAMASKADGGRGLSEDRAKALCGYIASKKRGG